MSIHFGGKKIKEMYWAGRKIKEAWYEGAKVYGVASNKPIRPWGFNRKYAVGDRVVSEGIVYECIKAHTSDINDTAGSTVNRPGSGWDQYTYWKQIGYAYEFDL